MIHEGMATLRRDLIILHQSKSHLFLPIRDQMWVIPLSSGRVRPSCDGARRVMVEAVYTERRHGVKTWIPPGAGFSLFVQFDSRVPGRRMCRNPPDPQAPNSSHCLLPPKQQRQTRRMLVPA